MKFISILLLSFSFLSHSKEREIMFEDPIPESRSISTLRYFKKHILNQSFCSVATIELSFDQYGNTYFNGFKSDESDTYLKLVIGNNDFAYLKLLRKENDEVIKNLGIITHNISVLRFLPNQIDHPDEEPLYFENCEY